MKLTLPPAEKPKDVLARLDARRKQEIRDEMVRRGDIVPFSDEWKEYVADAFAKAPHLRSETMRQAIKMAMEDK